MTFARQLTILLLASASLVATAQEPTPPPPQTQTPAPIVRTPPPETPAPTQTDTPPHLTVSHPAIKPAKPVVPTINVPPRPPTTTPTASASALTSPGSFNRTVILLDPAHGGGDSGARINDQIVEKDITLALAFRLRSLLSARGFTVTMTRDNDAAPSAPSAPLSLDDRAGLANHARPVACLLLHATASGSGVHLYTSELDPTPAESTPAPWLTAQAAWVSQSQRLASQIAAALTRAKIPLVLSRASVRPVDSLTCPALVVELAPTTSNAASLNDASYQQRVAEALAGALVVWQNQAQPPARFAPPPRAPEAPEATGEVRP
ncbi:MAG: N-acetylmuramoyl-L-alanine amidase [Acidobacteriaceae bacterium]